MTRARSEWHLNRSAKVAALPAQVNQRMDRVRAEVQHLQIPRMMDSPLLRRQGGVGLSKLDNVCDHYGDMVHPDAEWIFAAHNREFFTNVKLGNGISQYDKA